jgi:N-acetylglucosamine malate deacetylase 1
MNIVVIAPHPDDEAIGCGGTIRLHVERGDRVAVVFLTSGELGLEKLPPAEARRIREAEAEDSGRVLGVASLKFLRLADWYVNEHTERAAADLTPIFEAESPALLYVPHEGEWHPDHRASLQVVRGALKISGGEPDVRAYEVWTPLSTHDEAEDITATIAVKLRAVRCHRSQLAEFRYDRAVRGLALYRGALAAKCRYAEVFQRLSPRG